ncbi:MAG: DNA/RNA nuclease SfsA [Promethearchaeota archaeon]
MDGGGGPCVEFPRDLVEGRFLRRLNRFVVEYLVEEGSPGSVSSSGSRTAHLPNPGRLKGLLVPGARLLLKRATTEARHRHGVVLVEWRGHLVPVVSTLANRLAKRGLETGWFAELGPLEGLQPEVRRGGSRIDFAGRTGDGTEVLVEVKSCTHVDDEGVARFPDAPTERGRRHASELADWLEGGNGRRAAVLFVVQHPAARSFAPFDAVDPRFGDALRDAAGRGVEVLAYSTSADARRACLAGPLPVDLGTREGGCW